MSKCWFSRRVRPQNAGSSQSAQRFWPSIGTFASGWWTQHPLQGPILAASTKVRKTTLSHGTQRGWQTRRLVYHNIQYGSETKSIMTKAINELAQGITGRHERCRWLADTFCQNYLFITAGMVTIHLSVTRGRVSVCGLHLLIFPVSSGKCCP